MGAAYTMDQLSKFSQQKPANFDEDTGSINEQAGLQT